MSIAAEVFELLKGKVRYREGNIWQQKSGRWVTKKNGKIVPVKKNRNKKHEEEAAHDHARAAHEDHKEKTKKVEKDEKPKTKSPIKKIKPKKKSEGTSYKDQLKEHKAIQQASDKDKGGGGAAAGSVQQGAGDSSGEISSGVYRARGKEILVSRAELTQQPKTNHLDKKLTAALDPHQRDGVNLAIENYESGEKGFFNADGTGAGKTRQIIALAAHYKDDEHPCLIVTKNASIIKQNFTDDARAMGHEINHVSSPDQIKKGAINICTYAALSNMARRVTVADERLGELAKHAWKYKSADEFIKAVGADGMSAQDAYRAIQHTAYEKKMQQNYRQDPNTAARKLWEDFYSFAHGKGKGVSFSWSGKALKVEKAMGRDAKNATVADAVKTGMLQFDEAHELKNVDSAQSSNGLAMMDESKRVGLFTATPMDKPEHIHYLCNAFQLDYEKVLRYCGYSKGPSGNLTTNMPMEERFNAIGNIFMNLTHKGKMVKREVSLKNMDLKSNMVEMDESHKVLYNEAENFWAQKIAEAPYQAKMNLAGQATLAMRRLNEHFKIKSAVDNGIKSLKAGKQCVIFADNVGEDGKKMKLHKESNIEYHSTMNAAREMFASELKKHPDLSHIKVAEFHGRVTAKARKQAQKDFQDGKAHVFLTTPKSGGTGINLDDIRGDAPRSVHVLTPPLSANEFIQMIGRTNRLTTKSRSDINLHLTDTPADDKNTHALIEKVKTLGASVSGDYEGMKVPDKSVASLPGMESYHELGDQWESPNRPFIPMSMESWKIPMQKSLSELIASMIAWQSGCAAMMKAFVQVGPQGGHYYTAPSGNKVYITDAGHAFHKEISEANHPDLVTNAIMKMDRSHRKGELHDSDMQKLMAHAGTRVQGLLNAKKKHEEKKHEERVAVVTQKRRTTESYRKDRKARVEGKLKKRIKNAHLRVKEYEVQAEKIKDAHARYVKYKIDNQRVIEELEPQMQAMRDRAVKLRHYKETMHTSHPQYPKLIEALRRHNEAVKVVAPKYTAAKNAVDLANEKLKEILQLHNRGRSVMRAYARAVREDIDTMRKSLLNDSNGR